MEVLYNINEPLRSEGIDVPLTMLGQSKRLPWSLFLVIRGLCGGLDNTFPDHVQEHVMQAGAKGRSWQVLLKILVKDGILGLYAGYSATLLRNLPAGVFSYSSFEYLKAAVLRKTKQTNLEPIQSVCCGAIAASLTTPLDVEKTSLMTQVHGGNKVAAVMYSGVNALLKLILKEEGWIGLTSRVVHSACFSTLS
ncbi:hypothetical protein Gogos_002631 [Gossypium gossypioides]|uniref:Uncharacterized protein n=1 Tax=Gossypium gossypioides TaxID=34282 RepID=A0A7J9CJI0_GOSGO|nr:hypothetical protein [Gossypium gossypioides]